MRLPFHLRRCAAAETDITDDESRWPIGDSAAFVGTTVRSAQAALCRIRRRNYADYARDPVTTGG